MTKKAFYHRVTNSKIDIIHEFLQLLSHNKIPYCVIGGIGINAYCEPVVTLDFDCVVIMNEIEKLKTELKNRGFKVKSHPHTWEVTHKDSDIRIQIQRDERYQQFIKNAKLYETLGYTMNIARKEDILIGKLWAYQDPERDSLKKDKDLLDIKRLIQKYPKLRRLIPQSIENINKSIT